MLNCSTNFQAFYFKTRCLLWTVHLWILISDFWHLFYFNRRTPKLAFIFVSEKWWVGMLEVNCIMQKLVWMAGREFMSCSCLDIWNTCLKLKSHCHYIMLFSPLRTYVTHAIYNLVIKNSKGFSLFIVLVLIYLKKLFAQLLISHIVNVIISKVIRNQVRVVTD